MPVPAVEQAVAAEPAREPLSVLAVESAAVAPAAEAAAAIGLVSEPAAVKEPVVVSAVEPTAAGKGRPVLANGPVAATKECWVINPGISPKVIVRRIREGSAAAEAATPWELQAREPWDPSQRRGGRQRRQGLHPFAAMLRPVAPAAAAQGKRKASAGVAEGSRKRKKFSPVKIKDLH